MQVGLNAGFGDPLATEFAAVAAYGFAWVRQDIYAQDDPAVAGALVTECVGAPVRPLFLVGGGQMQHPDGATRLEPHELAAWTTHIVQTAAACGLTDYALEIGNEPDIAHPGYSDRPEDFAEAVRQCHQAARQAGSAAPILIGGIANLNNRGLRYLRRVLAVPTLPLDVWVGFHRYPEAGRGPLAPHDQFRSREAEWEAFTALIGPRPAACTEFGYQTAPVDRHGQTLTDAEVAEAVCFDLNFYAARGVPLACVYQLNDGPTDTAIDRYGMRRVDGTWKPVADAVRAWVQRLRVVRDTPWEETVSQLTHPVCAEPSADVDDEQVLQAMERYGGSFIRALAVCWGRADEDNRRVLRAAFSRYWAEYAVLSASTTSRRKDDRA